MAANFRGFLLCLGILPILWSCVTDTITDRSKVTYRNHGGPNAQQITAWIAKPEGDGPFPAIVLLHGCSGLFRERGGAPFKSLQDYQSSLREAGFVSLIVDSWGSRGYASHELWEKSCQPRMPRERLVDLTGAIRYLKTHAYVNPKAIGAVGQSQGAGAVLIASGWRRSDVREQVLNAGVAIYPGCHDAPRDVRIPLLILIGDADGITTARACRNWLEEYAVTVDQRLDDDGQPLGLVPELVVYPGAYHSYDLPLKRAMKTPIGTIKADFGATKDTHRRMIAFFRKHLQR